MRLRRSRENTLVSGVLGGVGEYFNIDPTIIRIGFVVSIVVLNLAPLIPLYILGALLIPKEDAKKNEKKDRMDRDSIDAYPKNDPREIKEEDWSDF